MRKKKGFSLIELLVVVLIMGILASVAMPQYFRSVEKSRASEAMEVLSNIADAEERAYMQKGTYVTKLSDLDIGISNLTYFTSTYGTVYADKGSYLNIQVQRTVSAGGGLGSYWIALHVPVIPGTGSRTWECGPASNRCRQFILGK